MKISIKSNENNKTQLSLNKIRKLPGIYVSNESCYHPPRKFFSNGQDVLIFQHAGITSIDVAAYDSTYWNEIKFVPWVGKLEITLVGESHD